MGGKILLLLLIGSCAVLGQIRPFQRHQFGGRPSNLVGPGGVNPNNRPPFNVVGPGGINPNSRPPFNVVGPGGINPNSRPSNLVGPGGINPNSRPNFSTRPIRINKREAQFQGPASQHLRPEVRPARPSIGGPSQIGVRPQTLPPSCSYQQERSTVPRPCLSASPPCCSTPI
ncbi:unnamed protein product [Meganyctiphanes norvegica]|uniref:Uncharacterized protein n=1 Tax=Meganyctiphanes norvegica TaxID=48144 RepID=A0AAV2SWQ1_MEGNR